MALSHKETPKLVITREDTGAMYSMAIKDYLNVKYTHMGIKG